MNFNSYQEKTATFRLPSYTPEACVMGLLSEGGEVAGVFQKLIRGDFPPDVAMTKLFSELGDVLWHLTEIASDNNWTLEDVAQGNIDKLTSRQLRNVIIGSGSER
jgi:NTP pyrophosphatase (non-canonical NTP hydrolase)